jgi:hypothetical protein
MAKGNMILTLVAQVDKWKSGLFKAGKDAKTFGSVVRGVATSVSTAFLGIAGAVLLFLPNFIKMGEEARKSERRLQNIAENTGLFEKNLEGVTKRISTYAEELSFLTGIDDELIRENEAVLLTFKNLAKSADEIGGPFDRAVVALLDLQAAGKKLSAVQLGKALQDPIANLTALKKAGILLTDEQKNMIAAFMAANDVIGAQDVLLGAIEDQVGGTAEATASATEKMSARFEDLLETLSDSLLPTVDTLADKFATWIESADGKKTIDELNDALLDFSAWISSPQGGEALDDMATTLKEMGNFARDLAGFLRDVKKWLDKITDTNMDFFDDLKLWVDATFPNQNTFNSGNPSAPGGGAARGRAPGLAPVVVNFNTPVDSVSAGREIARVLSDYDRARGMR